MKLKFFKSILLALMITVCLFKADVLANSNISMYIDNQEIEISDDILIKDGQILIPMEPICTALDYTIDLDAWWDFTDWNGWDLDCKIVISKEGLIPYVFRLDSFKILMRLGYNPYVFDIKPFEVDPTEIFGQPYIPLSELTEILDYNIVLDNNLNAIRVKKNPNYDGVESYNLEKIESNTINYGYLPQIVNPSSGESKINKSILLRLNDKVEDKITIWHEYQDRVANLIRNDYKYKITCNNNNLFSVSYDRIGTFDYQYTKFYSFGDTFYKSTGKRLQIEDILKGSKEEIENTLRNLCNKDCSLILKNTLNHNYTSLPDFETCEFEQLIDNYDFYIEDNYLFITVPFDYFGNYYYLFGINITDNADLFQEDFLENFNN